MKTPAVKNSEPESNKPLIVKSDEAARILDKATGTLSNWRSKGWGPPPIKIGGSIFYAMADLEAWILAQRQWDPPGPPAERQNGGTKGAA